MCFVTLISAPSGVDLTRYDSTQVRFVLDETDTAERGCLENASVWLLTDANGTCSCGFRNVELPNVQALGFDEPATWSPEELDDVARSKYVHSVFARLVGAGDVVDSFTFWNQGVGEVRKLCGTVKVSLSEVDAGRFRFCLLYTSSTNSAPTTCLAHTYQRTTARP